MPHLPHSLFASALIAAGAAACANDPAPVIPEPFCDNGCFDGDDCTDDLCRVDGTCLNVPRNPFGACQTEAHCDDGNSCSEDRCELDGCGLMRCVNEIKNFECRPCGEMFGDCSDFNPCTLESCGDDGICDMGTSNDPNCDPQCNQQDARSADAPLTGEWFGYQSWFIGVATTREGVNCDADACVCESELRFRDSLEGFELRDATGLNDPEWTCDIVACEPHSVSCRPLDAGVGYVVWGTMTYLNPFDAASPQDTAPSPDAGSADVAAPPMQPIDALHVDGYCLSTRLDHVIGDYAATFESDGHATSFDLRIAAQPDGVAAQMQACVGCQATGLVADQIVTLGAEIGTVTFPLKLTDADGFARLYAHTDHFVGDVRRSDGGYLGKLKLERVPR